MFSVHFDDRRSLIMSVRRGFYDLEAVAGYHQAVQAALGQAQRAGHAFDMLIDISDAQPLSSEIAAKFEHVAADIRASTVRRVAFVSPGAVNRIQARRITSVDPRFSTFTDKAAALLWLQDAG